MAIIALNSFNVIGAKGLCASSNAESLAKYIYSVTFETFQPEISWLKLVALSNILYIFVTFETFQVEISWLKLVAFANIRCIFVTFETSQPEISWLKFVLLWKRLAIYVISEVFTCVTSSPLAIIALNSFNVIGGFGFPSSIITIIPSLVIEPSEVNRYAALFPSTVNVSSITPVKGWPATVIKS